MAHFYGMVRGQAQTKASRLGSRASGLQVTAASWQGAVAVELFERDGRDYCEVSLTPWHGAGIARVLYSGPVDGAVAMMEAPQ